MTHPCVTECKDDGGKTVQSDGSAGGQLEVGRKVVEKHVREIGPERLRYSDSVKILSYFVNNDLKPETPSFRYKAETICRNFRSHSVRVCYRSFSVLFSNGQF